MTISTWAFAFALSFAAAVSAIAADDTKLVITDRTISIEAGDTLSSIAREELGKSGLAAHLADFNGISLSTTLIIGDELKIPLYAPFSAEYATVIFVKGDVNREGTALQRDDKIYQYEQIITGNDGFASLQFLSGSMVNLQPGTHVRLERLNCLDNDDKCVIDINTTRGEVSSDVRRRDDQPVEFTIRTPFASAAVRGTLFDFNASDSSLLVGVTEGDVLVNAANTDVEIAEGFGSVTEKGQPPSPPVALLPAPVFRSIPARIAAGDLIRWWGLSDVAQYTLDIAGDEEGVEQLVSFNSNTDSLTMTDVAAGDYFMLLRGVDAAGLKGYKTPAQITIAAIDNNVSPVNTTISRIGDEFLVEVIDPPSDAPGFEIQVSITEDFADPLSADVASTGAAFFRVDSDKVYTRARVLIDPQLVSAFGDIAESR